MRGFPIRKSWSQRPVIDSTRLIADSHVLHRLLLPRHPPCALRNFHTHESPQMSNYLTKMSFSASPPRPTRPPRGMTTRSDDKIRCSRPLYSSQTTALTPLHAPRPGHASQGRQKQHTPHPNKMQGACCSRTQQCANTSTQPPTTRIPTPQGRTRVQPAPPLAPFPDVPPMSNPPSHTR